MYANTHLIAKEISRHWKALGPEGQKPWKARAREEERQFRLKYPDYHYDPRKPAEIPRRNKPDKIPSPNVELGTPIPDPDVPANVAENADVNAHGADQSTIVDLQNPQGFGDDINAYGADDDLIVEQQYSTGFDSAFRAGDYTVFDGQNSLGFDDGTNGELFGIPGGLYGPQY